MNPNTAEALDYRGLLENSLLQIRKMRLENDALKYQRTEPIAVVGMACRFPGANDLDSYWRLLSNGLDAIREVPKERWDIDEYYDPDPNARGKMYTRYGGFVEDVAGFDPRFFGIPEGEASSIDPQHRLLLEVAWEALENAGQPSERVYGSQTGVFIGVTTDDYSRLSASGGMDAYSVLGGLRCMAAGRLSYVLNLRGPSVQMDTACSSSLLTVHQACQSLRSRECGMAIAGGINLMLSPETTIALCQLRALTPDRRCKTFDNRADGYVRGEGCGIVVLKRLSDALADRDSILGVIKGSAVNHDGRSNGLTAPSRIAQEAAIRQALDNAGIAPGDVQYVETHGTGTPLGDPIEVLALSDIFGRERPTDEPLAIGSVKTNIGHLEAAAGIAGLIKVILSLQNRQLPPHLHLSEPNTYIPWQQIPVTVPRELTPWQTKDGRRLAGISSFGMSGTNVHLVVENQGNS
jgi:acyl transferase domain-containing protein